MYLFQKMKCKLNLMLLVTALLTLFPKLVAVVR